MSTIGPVTLAREEIEFFEEVRRHLMEDRPFDTGAADTLVRFQRTSLPQRFWGFGLTVYQPGNQRLMVVRATGTPAFKNVSRVIERALAHPRIGEFDFADRARCRIQFDFIVDKPEAVELSTLSESSLESNRFEVGVDGLRIVGGARCRYMLPGDAFVWSILTIKQLRQHIARLFPGTSIDQLECYRLRSASYVSSTDGWLRLYRGYPAVSPVSQDALYGAARAGVNWIVQNQQHDGRFVYYYDAATDSHRDHEHPKRDPETNPYYNLLRHCGGVITALLYEALRGVGETQSDDRHEQRTETEMSRTRLRRSIEASIDFYIRQLVTYDTPRREEAAYAFYNRKAKLGGSGVGLYMLALYQKLFGDTRYADHAKLLCRHLASEIQGTGEFMYYHVYLDKRVPPEMNRSLFSFYYPGEAIIGLANYCRHVCESDGERAVVYGRTHDALRFLLVDRPRIYKEHYASLPADSWLMMGINDLWDEPQFRKDMYSQFVFQGADQMVAHMYTPRCASYPDYVGSFFYKYGDHPYPDGARAEGLLAAYMLARKTGDHARIDRYRKALDRLAWATLRLSNTRDSAYSVPNPELAIGGIRFKFTRQWFRVDTIQHVASFYLKFLPIF